MQYLMTWFLIAVRQEVKRIDKSVVVEQPQNPTMGVTINIESTTTEPPP